VVCGRRAARFYLGDAGDTGANAPNLRIIFSILLMAGDDKNLEVAHQRERDVKPVRCVVKLQLFLGVDDHPAGVVQASLETEVVREVPGAAG